MLTFDQLCRGLEVEISAFAICEVRYDGAFALHEETDSSIHYILSGEGVALQSSGEVSEVSPHTVIIVPPGGQLTIAHDADQPRNPVEPQCEPLAGGWNLLTLGDEAPSLILACGYVHARFMQIVELFDFLREPLIVSVATDKSFQVPFQQLLDELAEPKPGTRVLAEMLMKQCLIALLRNQSEATGECFVPWLAALGDPSLAKAIAAMMDAPQESHTLESLGEIAGMSRGAFAEHFKEAFGRTAIDCLKEIRLRRAAQLLSTTNKPVKSVAIQVGFESRSYFSHAFKEFAGLNPAEFRASRIAQTSNVALGYDPYSKSSQRPR